MRYIVSKKAYYLAWVHELLLSSPVNKRAVHGLLLSSPVNKRAVHGLLLSSPVNKHAVPPTNTCRYIT